MKLWNVRTHCHTSYNSALWGYILPSHLQTGTLYCPITIIQFLKIYIYKITLILPKKRKYTWYFFYYTALSHSDWLENLMLSLENPVKRYISVTLCDREYNIKCLGVFLLRTVSAGWLAGGDQNILSFRPTQPEKITNIQPSVISPMISWKSPDYLRQARPGQGWVPPAGRTDGCGEWNDWSLVCLSVHLIELNYYKCSGLGALCLSPLHTNTHTILLRYVLEDDIPV